jgi:hypothetical protein
MLHKDGLLDVPLEILRINALGRHRLPTQNCFVMSLSFSPNMPILFLGGVGHQGYPLRDKRRDYHIGDKDTRVGTVVAEKCVERKC